ncbi:hypothetical protein CPC08DRAFT_796108 [Agrocybe pediades]|nr:hypothetical protein CPC08DRAFT_796108 [Agrocybe pediades]
MVTKTPESTEKETGQTIRRSTHWRRPDLPYPSNEDAQRFLTSKPTCTHCSSHSRKQICQITHSDRSFVCDRCARMKRGCSLYRQYLHYKASTEKEETKNVPGGQRLREKASKASDIGVKGESVPDASGTDGTAALPSKKRRRPASPVPRAVVSAVVKFGPPKKKKGVPPSISAPADGTVSNVIPSSSTVESVPVKFGPPRKKKKASRTNVSAIFTSPPDSSTSGRSDIERLRGENANLRAEIEVLRKAREEDSSTLEDATKDSDEGESLADCCEEFSPMLKRTRGLVSKLHKAFTEFQPDAREEIPGEAEWGQLKDCLKSLKLMRVDSSVTASFKGEIEELQKAREEDSKQLMILSGLLNNFVRKFTNHGREFKKHNGAMDTKAYDKDLDQLQELIDTTLMKIEI